MSKEVIVLRSAFYAKYYDLHEGHRAIIGRAEDADINILEGSLSRRHCCLERRKGVVYLEDLQSSNGTFVNGRRIQRRQLHDGDRIRFGTMEFRFAHEKAEKQGKSHLASSAPGMKISQAHHNLMFLTGAMHALVGAVEARDPYTSGHSARVTSYSLQLGRATGVPNDGLDIIEMSGLLHDIGKIAIPDKILRKLEKLTDKEQAIVKEHSRIGYRILCHIQGSESVCEAVLHHHERWDGRGYPEGLGGEGISLVSRILAVADTFDAMGSKRPYRPALPVLEILKELEREKGRQFDPKVAQCLLDEIRLGRVILPREWAEKPTSMGDGLT